MRRDPLRTRDQLADAFQHGGGIPQAEYGERFWSDFERFTATGFRHFLCQEWIPALPSADTALRAGGSAADVGCGNGQALLSLARGYPNARLIGLDSFAPPLTLRLQRACRRAESCSLRGATRRTATGR
jgi:tRNA G46 methylase TrmB